MTEFARRSSAQRYGFALSLSVLVVCGIGAFLLDTGRLQSSALPARVDAIGQPNQCDPDAPEWTAPQSDDRASDSSDDDDDDGSDAAITVEPLRASDSGHVWREDLSIAKTWTSVDAEGHLLRGPPSVEKDVLDADIDDDDEDRSPGALVTSSTPADRRQACLFALHHNSSLSPASYDHSLRAPPQ